MPRRAWILFLPFLAACASTPPVPVGDPRPPVQVERAPVAAPLATATPPAPPVAAGRTYTVKRGDTLIAIALDHGLDHRELAAWNQIEDPNRIRVGQQLRLDPPAGAPVGSAPTQAAAQVRPVVTGETVATRPLGERSAAADTERMKREPKGEKLPEENQARLKGNEPERAAQPAPPVQPAASTAPLPAAPAAITVAGIEWSWPAQGTVLAGFNEGQGGQNVNKGIHIAGKLGDPVLAAAAGRVIYVGVFPRHGNLVVLLHAGGHSSVYAHNSRIVVREGQTVTRGQKIAELGDTDAERPMLHFEVRQQGKPLDPMRFLPPRS